MKILQQEINSIYVFCTRKIVQAQYLVLMKMYMAQSKREYSKKINVRKTTDQLKVIFIHTKSGFKLVSIKCDLLNGVHEILNSS